MSALKSDSAAKLLRNVSIRAFAAGFMIIGIMHFIHPEPFVRIVPAMLPQPLALVFISGAFEIAGGIGLLFSRTRRLALYGLIMLLIAVFPANINMAINNITFDGTVPTWALWLRLPLQFVLIGWLWWSARE